MQPAHLLAAAAVSALVVTGVGSVPALAGAGVFDKGASAGPRGSRPDDSARARSGQRPDLDRARVVGADDAVAGVILSFDSVVLTVAGVDADSTTSIVTRDTVVKVEELSPDADKQAFDRGSIVHLAAGVVVADLDIDPRSGALEEISVYRQG